jgi:Cytochrome c554 and c-prime
MGGRAGGGGGRSGGGGSLCAHATEVITRIISVPVEVIMLAIGLDCDDCNAGYYMAMPTGLKGLSRGALKSGRTGLTLIAVAMIVLAGWLYLSPKPTAMEVGGDSLDADPLERARFCRRAGVAELITLASDTDWRVRAAAFEAMGRLDPIDPMPLRDTPIDQREALLLDWLDRNAPTLSSDLCEVYIRPNHLRFGPVLTERCMTCHAGPVPDPGLADTRCADCHHQIHAQWAGTAHANSLSHLTLRSVDSVTRQPGAFDFGDRKGLTCIACHSPEATRNTPGTNTDCLTPFKAVACSQCHSRTALQWAEWKKKPHYRQASWPPGSIERVNDNKPMTCIGCHMPDGQHLWAARRDMALLRGGITMTLRQEGKDGLYLSLRNLAGHAYPTGSHRRALRLYIQLDDGPEQLLATLADRLNDVSHFPDTSPALQPGETRLLPLPDTTGFVRARLVYVRNRFDTDSYTAEVQTLNRAVQVDHHP